MGSESLDISVRNAIEHTLLAADATAASIDATCEAALTHRLGGVCINPAFVARCRRELNGSAVRIVSVVGFPLGASVSACKAFECERALADGADEIDMVMLLGAAKAGDWAAVEADARIVVRAAGGHPVKLILETGVLDDAQKRRACHAAIDAGVAFVKTCTGFAAGVASVDDVRLLAEAVSGRLAIKASAGIRTLSQARALLAAGASRIGTSAGVAIANELAAEVQ